MNKRNEKLFHVRALEEHVFLIVHDVHSSPVDGNDHVILGQTRAGKLVRFVEAREEEWPLVLGKLDHHLLDLGRLVQLATVPGRT